MNYGTENEANSGGGFSIRKTLLFKTFVWSVAAPMVLYCCNTSETPAPSTKTVSHLRGLSVVKDSKAFIRTNGGFEL